VEHKLKILGVGINRLLWWKLTRVLRKFIGFKSLEIGFAHISEKNIKGRSSYYDEFLKSAPDVVFTSLSIFKDLSDFESFLESCSRIDTKLPTNVLLIESQVKDFLKTYLSTHPLAVFNFNDHSGLSLADSVYIANSEGHQALPARISPSPTIKHSAGSDIFLDDNQKISFYLLEEVESLDWEGATYEVEDFLTLQTEFLSAHDWITNVTGFLLKNGETYLSDGFRIRDLVNMETASLPIDHLLSTAQITNRTKDFYALIFKFRELVRSRINYNAISQVSSDSGNIKANIPVSVCSEHTTVNRIFNLILESDGYGQVTTIEDQVDQNNRFLLNPSTKPEKNSPLYLNLMLEPKIFAIQGFSKITTEIYSSPKPIKEWAEISEIQAERSRMAKQMQKLDDQIRSLSGSKMMADQEKYINILASRKQEILKTLLEISYIWDEAIEVPPVSGNEELLIFYDDQLQATTLNNLLSGRGKKLYVDVLQQIGDIKKLIALNTDYLESFLHKGIVICCASSKAILTRKLHQFRNELAQYESPDLSDAIKKLNSEKDRCQKRLLGLAFEEAYFELKKFYGKFSTQIFEAAKIAHFELEKRLLQSGHLRRISICSLNKERCEQIEFALNKCLSELDGRQFNYVMGHPGLKTTLENEETITRQISGVTIAEQRQILRDKLVKANAKKVNDYFQNLLSQIEEYASDLLVVEQDIMLLSLFIPLLRQENNVHQHTPIIGIFSGEIDVEKLDKLARLGVKLMYRNQFRLENKDYLVDPLQMILSSEVDRSESIDTSG